MGANVNFYQAQAFQVDQSVANWHWQLGDGHSYWGFSVRPANANDTVELQRVMTVSDNFSGQTTFLTVSVGGAGTRSGGSQGLINFAAIGSS